MKETQLDGESLDIVSDNVSKLKEIFPEVITEDKIDFDKLKLILGSDIDTDSERYSFTWPGKTQAIKESQKQSTGTLRPCKEESKNWDTTKNLYIEGDNLEVLKLLQKGYYNKVKMIFIDPPYNTGNDFVYNDDYSDNLDNYLKFSSQIDEEGYAFSTNKDNYGRYHTKWLNMMYSRLKLAKNLLRDDGVIFITIDDNEYVNLKKLCDEIFGEDNLETTFYVKVRHENRILRQDIKYQLVIEQVLCYRKTSKYQSNRIYKEKNVFEEYIYDIEILNDPIETINIGNYDVDIYSEKDYKIIESEGSKDLLKKYQIRGSLISQSGSASEFYEKYLRKRRDVDGLGALYKVNGMGIRGDGLGYRYIIQPSKEQSKNGFYFQGFPLTSKVDKGLPYPNYYDFVKEMNNVGAEGDITFKNGKKPLDLIKKLFEIGNIFNDSNALVMDFFSGSSTTAHALLKLNNSDNGNRNFIMVQLPEINTENNYEDYKNICEIGKERIRRAGDKIVQESGNKDLDIGFKVFKLDSSNLNIWDPEYDDLEQTLLFAQENIKRGRTQEDLIYEIMLKYGIDLTLPIEEYDAGENKIYSIGFGALLICLDNKITKDITDSIIELSKDSELTRVVFKDNGFASDADKTNIKETLRINYIEEFITI